MSTEKLLISTSDEILLDMLKAALERLSVVDGTIFFSSDSDAISTLADDKVGLQVVFGSLDEVGLDLSVRIASSCSCSDKPTIGYQRHLTSGELIGPLYKQSPLSLGGLRDMPDLIEPLVREATAISWSNDVIRRSDCGCGPVTGMTVEEACQVARIIGECSHLEHLVIEVPPSNYPQEWVDCYATVLWYLAEGYRLGRQAPEQQYEDMQEIIVAFEDVDILILQSERSGKLWIKTIDNYIPIHSTEYDSIKQGNLPSRVERLLY